MTRIRVAYTITVNREVELAYARRHGLDPATTPRRELHDHMRDTLRDEGSGATFDILIQEGREWLEEDRLRKGEKE